MKKIFYSFLMIAAALTGYPATSLTSMQSSTLQQSQPRLWGTSPAQSWLLTEKLSRLHSMQLTSNSM